MADLVTSAKRAETRERIERKRKELRNWQTKWYRHVHTRVCKTCHRSPLPRLSANQVSVFHAANTRGSLNFQLLSGKYRWRDGKPATDKVPSRKARITAYFLLRLPRFVSRRKKANLRTLCGVRSRNKFYSYLLPSPPMFVIPLGDTFSIATRLLYFCPSFVFSSIRSARRSLLNIAPIACYSVTNVLSFFIAVFEWDRAYLSLHVL